MSRIVVFAASLLLLSIGTGRAACDPAAIASTRAAAELQCPCASAVAHAAYVHCVAEAAKIAVKNGSLPKTCRAEILRCAKKSTCGSAGFVACCRTSAKGATKCSVKSSEAKCTASKGGAACVGTTSCCDACAGGSCGVTPTTTTPGTTLGEPRTHTVMVGPGGALVFRPANATVAVGDTVRWVWQSGGHSVVSGLPGSADGLFCSPSDSQCPNALLSNGGSTYEHTFTQAGTFPYYCSVHFVLGMTGTITVR